MSEKDKRESKKQRRRRFQPPARLGWPSASTSSNGGASLPPLSSSSSSPSPSLEGKPSTESSTSRPINKENKEKNPKRARRVTFHDQQSASSLWVETYAPKQSKHLCVAPKKMKEMTLWIQEAFELHQQQKKLLILVGSPGIGKSTAVRVLCKEHEWDLSEWTESYSTHIINSGSQLLSVDQQTPTASFESFLNQAGAGYQSLVLTSSEESSVPPKAGTKRKASSNDPTSSSSGRRRTIILLDELPNRYGPEAELKFREIMNAHVRQSAVPTILVFSDVVEGKHKPEDLERLLDPNLLYSSAVQILQIHPPTKARMKRVIESIVKEEGLDVSSSSSPPDFYEDLYTRSNGDLRFAITTLQYERYGLISTQQSNNKGGRNTDRDKKLTTFHALGKLLYAKRKTDIPLSFTPANNKWDDGRPPIDFDPERVVEQSDMELSGSLAFLEYHCVDFFTDIAELSGALDRFSDAAALLDRPFEGRHRDSIFPEAYAGSLAGRAVANFNKNPSANKFRQFTAPKMFEVNRKRRENEGHIGQLHKRLSLTSDYLSLSSVFGLTAHFATDCLPYVRKILPFAVDQMHSHFRPMHGRNQAKLTEQEVEILQKEQEEILRSDDIADFESDDDDIFGGPTQQAMDTGAEKKDCSSISPTSTVDVSTKTVNDSSAILNHQSKL